jgi:hypothetical protein
VGISLSRYFWLTSLLSVGVGCSFLMLGSCSNAVLQARSEPALKGRVVSLYSMMFLGMSPLGGMLLGWLAEARGAPLALFTGGTLCLAVAAAVIAFPGFLRGADSRLGVDNVGHLPKPTRHEP